MSVRYRVSRPDTRLRPFNVAQEIFLVISSFDVGFARVIAFQNPTRKCSWNSRIGTTKKIHVHHSYREEPAASRIVFIFSFTEAFWRDVSFLEIMRLLRRCPAFL
jgi:hypothetical protein